MDDAEVIIAEELEEFICDVQADRDRGVTCVRLNSLYFVDVIQRVLY